MSGYEILREIFPNIPQPNINDVIMLIEEQMPDEGADEKLEQAFNLLSGEIMNAPVIEHNEEEPDPVDTVDPVDINYDLLFNGLSRHFPDMSETFLLNYCQNAPENSTLDEAILDITQTGYEKKEIDPLVIWDQLKQALPNADPSYLRTEANRLAVLDQQDIDNFVQDAIENEDYPTMDNYLKNRKETETASMYKRNFNVTQFLEIFPFQSCYLYDLDKEIDISPHAYQNEYVHMKQIDFIKYKY